MARSITASTMACPTIDASHDCLRTVSRVYSRVRMGFSIMSAESSKNEMTVLSFVMNIDTCSAITARSRDAKAACFSMNSTLASLGPELYR